MSKPVDARRPTLLPSPLRSGRALELGAHGLGRAVQILIVLAVLGALLALILRSTATYGTPGIAQTGQARADPASVVNAYLAARADADVAGVRALFDDQAVVDITGQRIQVWTLHLDSEISHWLIQEPRQFTSGPLRVDGDQVTWHEQVVDNEVRRLPGVPAAVRNEDAEAIVHGGKITLLTFTVSPPGLLAGPASDQPTDPTTQSTGNPPLALSFGVLTVLVLGVLFAWWLEGWLRSRGRQ